MSPLRGLANRKLYHAAILIRMLEAELAREDLPARVVLEAVGLAVRQHLLEGYGWFLLELAGVEQPPATPPCDTTALRRDYGFGDPPRGELVELEQLESGGWLADLLSTPSRLAGGRPAGPDQLATSEQSWSSAQLRGWHDGLAELIDRLGHGLDEW